MPVRVRDRGADALMRRMKQKATVKVGIIGQKAAAGKTQGKGLTVVDVASFHEFGLGVPQRSFIAAYVDENEQTIKAKLRRAAEQVEKGMPLEQALDLVGLFLVGGMQERISNGIEPPLKPETIKRKGSSKPLINTGQLRSSITHEVNTGRSRA